MLGKPLLRLGLVFASCLWLAGCAGPSAFFRGDESVPAFRDKNMSMPAAMDAIVLGASTKADVLAALGNASVIKFDSGYEVWAYRAKGPETEISKPELVILFAPSGIVKKTRIRPAYEKRGA